MIKNSTLSYNGFLKIYNVDVEHETFDNSKTLTYKREVMDRNDAVVVIPWHKETNKVVLTRQYRAPTDFKHNDPFILDAVAGVVEEDNCLETALRELKEEVGVTEHDVNKLHYVGHFYPSAGGCSEKVHLYVAEIKNLPNQNFGGLEEEHENIKIEIYTVEEIINMIGNKFNCPTAVIGIMQIYQGKFD